MSVDIDLSGQVALITGGTRGIGAGIAERFLAAGADVHVCSRREPAALPESAGRKPSFHAVDVRDAEQVGELVDRVVSTSGRLDALVNNAGGAPPAETASASARFHSKVVELNLVAPLLVAQTAWPVLRAHTGNIIMISSIAGSRAAPTVAAYGAAKSGLNNLTRTLSWEFAPHVRVNAVSVGLARTESYVESYGEQSASDAEPVPLGRNAEPADVGHACLFLASPLASFVTGTSLAVDGGSGAANAVVGSW